jgi:flagellar L-ring protein precursor FlgH
MNPVVPRLLLVAAALAAAGCMHLPEEPRHSPRFEPVYPSAVSRPQAVTGSIYNSEQGRDLFSRGLSYRVGDVITILLNESSQAARQQSTQASRESKNTVVPPGLTSRVSGISRLLDGLSLSGGSIASEGTGTADQRASLTGSVSATVVEVMSNGNLVLRGEKQLALTEGAEIIQVTGIVRPDDVSRNNTVQSRRLANAQITYRGTGDLANASRAGWGSSLLWRIWPF